MSNESRAKMENKLAKIEWVVARFVELGRVPPTKLLAKATDLRIKLS